MKGFIDFIREQGVMGLAIGFMLGGAASTVARSLVSDIVNPVVGIFLGKPENLKELKFTIAGSEVLYGNFLSSLLDFVVIAIVVYYVFKGLKLDKLLDKKKE